MVLASLIVLLVLGVAVWFRTAALRALPQLDGEIRISGLSGPVAVIRDPLGVPTISAENYEDLFFAQGYVTAQDRLWQMDMTRRYAAGELSEVLGSSMLETDTYQRHLGLRQVAQQASRNLSVRDRAFLDAYARGVNTYITQHHGSLPIEFRVLRYSPLPWTTEDTFLVGASMLQFLNHGYFAQELQREHILARLGPELTADLYVNSSFRDIPPGTARNQLGDSAHDIDLARPPLATRYGQGLQNSRRSQVEYYTNEVDPLFPGSNNWVLAGAHTASGKPLLSNDMHLQHRLPNTWYEAHLRSGSLDVVGVTLPGVPFVIVGHNQRIAWGFTNIGPDVEDIFIETFNDNGDYQSPEGWLHPEVRKENIRVKNGRDKIIDILVTRNGPIITPLLKNEKRKLALKWVIHDKNAMTLPFFDVNLARNWEEFREAFEKFAGPAQNVLYADVDGHIGYQATGLIPIRGAGDGSLPMSGADNVHQWTGYIPFEQLPSVYDPSSGVLATANGRITPNGYPYSISTQWGSPYRTEQIYRVLRNSKQFTPGDMLALQTDVYSAFDKFTAERFVYAVDRGKNVSARARQAANLMRNWDGQVTKDSAAATINYFSRRKFSQMLLEAKLGSEYKMYNWFMSPVWLESIFLFHPQRWLPSNFKNYQDLMVASVEAAVSDTTAPEDLSAWNWGDAFPVEISHPLFGGVPILSRWTGSGIQPQSGNAYTIKQVGRTFGPSQRMTVDLSNFDASTLNIVNGQSGNVFSPHFNEQFASWLNGTTFTLPYSESAVNATRQHQLVLRPQ